MSVADEPFMHRCLALAALGQGYTAPNPMVGAVLVHAGRILGEGFHRRCGAAHAEINCLDAVQPEDRHLIPEATLYVSLEPCVHSGKTPPCTDRILRERIPEVVVAAEDPFPQVAGKGIRKLVQEGVRVRTGILEKEANLLNRRFLTFHTQARPYIILKWAQTADGKIAGPHKARLKISNALTGQLVHQWRAEESAIMVGTTTALLDDPRLTVRNDAGNNPLRIVIDRDLRLPKTLQLFHPDAETIVFNTLKETREQPIQYLRIEAADDLLPDILKRLYQCQVQSVLVEGGAVLLSSFFRAGTWDEIRRITARNQYAPEGYPAPVMPSATLLESYDLAEDRIDIFSRL